MSRPQDADSPGDRPAGPVAGSRPSSSQAAGEDPDPTPPAGDAAPQDDPGSEAAGAGSEQVEKDIADLLAEAEKQRDEYLDLAKRTKADFENYRKRIAADVQAAAMRGKAELARELIDAVDNLERALQAKGMDPDQEDPLSGGAAEEQKEDMADGFGHGVLLVFLGLRETLRRNGIESVDPKGERFDPQWHEALSTQPGDTAEPGTVVEVLQKGYRLGEQLIRPARVVVAE